MLYVGNKELVLTTNEFVDGFEESEIEDLLPSALLIQILDRIERRAENDFESKYDSAKPIVPQIKNWAKQEGFELPTDWKIQLALGVKSKLISDSEKYVDETMLKRWTVLFEKF